MPSLNQTLEEETLFRLLCYGPPMTKKTWFAGRAAEAGFNVLMLDCDGKVGILKHLSTEAKKRIFVVNIMDNPKQAVAAEFLTLLLARQKLLWNQKTKMSAFSITEEARADSIYIDATKLDSNWVLVLDSYTAMVWSLILRFSIENKIDLSDAKKVEWEGYGWSGRMATWMITTMKHLFKCHTVVIGHRNVYEKRKTVIVNGKKEQTLEWQREQIVSTSGPHAGTIGKEFTDILKFYIVGNTFKIESRAGSEQEGGGIFIPPDVYNWNDLTFEKIIKLAGMSLPDKDLPFPDFSITDDLMEKLKPKSRRNIILPKTGVQTQAEKLIASEQPNPFNFAK